jgi:Raf kinase inhibitor-like YbhB/YbcL family protein
MKFLLFLFLFQAGQRPLSVTSPAFKNGERIPSVYTCQGRGINPELIIRDIPRHTKSLVVLVEDPDAPHGTVDHWVMWNVPPERIIHENSSPGRPGKNTRGQNGYMGPCPPTGSHRYFFKVFALDTMLDLPEGADKKQVNAAMKGHVVTTGTLMGLYSKS